MTKLLKAAIFNSFSLLLAITSDHHWGF